MSITTAIAAVKAQMETDCAALTDTRAQLDCTLLIERWAEAETAAATEEANSIAAYTIEGRSVTKKSASGSSSLRRSADGLRDQISAILFGGGFKVADVSGAED